MGAQPLQYLLPGGTAPLEAELDLEEGERRPAVERTFYDSFDGRLHAAGIALVHEGGRLVVAGAGGHDERAATERARAPRSVTAAELPAPMRERLEPLLEMRVALPAARVRSRSRELRVLDVERKTVVRLVVEEPDGLAARLHVVPVRGYDKALKRVRRKLEESLALAPAAQPLVDEAVLAQGGIPGGVSSKLDVELDPDEPASHAAAKVLARLLEVIHLNMPGTLDDVDTEFLHDLRVAVRRTRAVQRELSDVFPPVPLSAYRAGFKWLQQVTGPTRDLDVQLLEFEDPHGELEPLRALLAARRERERRAMVKALRSDRTTALLAGWAQQVESLRLKGSDPVSVVAAARIERVHRGMVKRGTAIGPDSPHEALHDLRKKGKELRYLLEFFGGLYSKDVVRPMVKALKALQDTLGTFQDREVQAALLRSLGPEIAARPDGPAALMAMGRVVDRLEAEQAQARAEFDRRFAAFAAPDQRRLVKKTFG